MSETPAAEDNAPSAVSDINMADESLYTDFTNYKESDNKKVPQAPQSSTDDDKPKEHTNKRPNRKDWLDTDNPLHCKPCDFTAKDIQVHVQYISRVLFDLHSNFNMSSCFY